MSSTRTNITARINIDVTASAASQATPGRKRLLISEDDHVSLEWWDAQVSPSPSVRLLILEEAAKYGAVDRITRTGSQQASAGVADPRDIEIATLKIELANMRESLELLLTPVQRVP